MNNRRTPLAHVPNAINSPLKSTSTIIANGKRTRAQVGDSREFTHGQPPSKKQMVENVVENIENADPATRPLPSAFERRSVSVREKKISIPPSQPRIDKAQRTMGDNLESVRQWNLVVVPVSAAGSRRRRCPGRHPHVRSKQE